VQLKVALAAAERNRVPEYRKAADDAATSVLQAGAQSLKVLVELSNAEIIPSRTNKHREVRPQLPLRIV
jgi:hypothetical protein